MVEEHSIHQTSVSLVRTGSAPVDAGAGMALKVRLQCAQACDLRGRTIRIIGQDAEIVVEVELVLFEDTANETDEFIVKAPAEPGQYTWTVVFSAEAEEALAHEESSTPFSFVVKPHTTSMAVWDVPSPVTFGRPFTIKLGVHCSAECRLADRLIAICDQAGSRVGTGTLRATPWSETSGLYWTEIELLAPSTAGLYTWVAKFPKPDLELAHEGSAHSFSFATAAPPEHTVTVQAVDRESRTPIKDASVLVDLYRTFTDERGVAKLNVPKGNYELIVSRHCYERFQTMVDVAGDLAVQAELLYDPLQLDTA